jgi:hypothetical protein
VAPGPGVRRGEDRHKVTTTLICSGVAHPQFRRAFPWDRPLPTIAEACRCWRLRRCDFTLNGIVCLNCTSPLPCIYASPA